MPLPIVAIVGRPNVGKSSMFNRMIKKRLAVVDSVSGVTRDRNFAPCDWNGRDFYLVDTGGMVPGTDDQMEQLILEQAQIGLDEADIIIFMVDCQTGITDLDSLIARQLLRADKSIIISPNKADNEQLEMNAGEFYSLGFKRLFCVSAANGRGVGDLLDEIIRLLPETEAEKQKDNRIRVAVVGRPNVGKSSFVNCLLGEERHIVSEHPGTTRDSIDSVISLNDKSYVLVDTAGLRKKSRIKENIEFYTTLRTFRAVQRCDVALILLDANEGLNVQELKIIDEVAEAGRGMVLAVNKWDIFEKDEKSAMFYSRQLAEAMPTFNYIPSIFTSAKTGQRVAKTLSLIDRVYHEYTKRIETSALNKFLEGAVKRQPPPATKGKWIKFYYISQPNTAPPLFVVATNYPQYIQDPYRRYLINRLREQFGFEGIPLRIKFKGRSE
ncbi:MAG: ribosome biogenesis GTPase Der [Candidatus Zixiibacteriota bacterium]